MVRQLLFSGLFFISSLHAMDLPVQGNSRQRIFSRLAECTTVAQARNVLLPVEDLFLMRDAIKSLAVQFKLREHTVVMNLNTVESRRYKCLGDQLIEVIRSTCTAETNGFVVSLIAQGADPNFDSLVYDKPLMNAVYMNKIDTVGTLVCAGARLNDYHAGLRCVRNFNLIYNSIAVKSIFNVLIYCKEKKDAGGYSTHFDTFNCPCAELVLYDALCIDKMLESYKAFNSVWDAEHPLIAMIRKRNEARKAVKRVFKYDRTIMQLCIPENIMNYLYPSKRKRSVTV
jgi:hypothetical protein